MLRDFDRARSDLKVPLYVLMLMILSVTTAGAADTAAGLDQLNILGYIVIGIVLLGTLFAIAATKAAVANSTWSLSDALSEEADITLETKDANGVTTPKLDDNAKPIMVSELRASTSRLIAFMGLIVIMSLYLGFGVCVLYSFAAGRGVPSGLDEIYKFLFAGMTLFAPYIANKFASVFSWMTPKN
jgi:hypothetical protein